MSRAGRPTSQVAALLGALVLVASLAGCASGSPQSSPPAGPPPTPNTSVSSEPAPTSRPPTSAPTAASSTAPTTATTATPEPGTVPPPWLGTRVLPTTSTGYGEIRPTPPELRDRRFTLPDTVAALPGRGFESRVVSPPPPDVVARSTYESGCPVGVADLAWVRLTFRGFDGARHTGELLTNDAAADDLVQVFGDLWDADFPLEELRIATRASLDAPPTGDGNATGSFVCRPVVGETTFSQHAYGLAIDVNSFQNPYVNEHAGDSGDERLLLPELASAYLERDDVRPGMITPDGPVVAAFDRIGWTWGGTWHTKKDYQHFSLTGG